MREDKIIFFSVIKPGLNLMFLYYIDALGLCEFRETGKFPASGFLLTRQISNPAYIIEKCIY